MKFVYHPEFVGVAFKAPGFSANMGGVGPAPPPGVLAFCAVAVQERYFTLFLYDPQGQVTVHSYPFAGIPVEDLVVNRIDVTGNPVVVVHDGIVKVFYAQYFEGPRPEELWRFNTGYRLEE